MESLKSVAHNAFDGRDFVAAKLTELALSSALWQDAFVLSNKHDEIPGEPIRHGFQFTDISHSTGMTLGRILVEAL